MEIAVVSLSNRAVISDITWPVMQKYCSKHGYSFTTIKDTLDVTRHPAWSKLLAIRMALEQKSADMVVWIDDDQYITNPSMTLDSLVENTPFDRILMTEDSGPWSAFNSGIMFCKNTDEGRDHFDYLYDLAEKYPELERFYQEPMWEQSGMDFFHKNVDDKFYRIVPMYPIQGFVGRFPADQGKEGLWFPGVFTAHVPGRDMSLRLIQLKSLAEINNWED